MRDLGRNVSRDWPIPSRFPRAPNRFDNVPLVQIYIVYVSAIDNRTRSVGISRESYKYSNWFIQHLLSVGLELCETIRPKALVSTIHSILVDDMALNQNGQIFLFMLFLCSTTDFVMNSMLDC